jgi:aarF domain-containing kinase
MCTGQTTASEISAQLSLDERETTEFILELVAVAEKNGLKLPREFGILLKQVS